MCGIGLYERGRFTSWVDGRNGNNTTEYTLWVAMLQRCQPGGVIQKRQPTYIGCYVHPDFINFQWFAEWCQSQIGFGLKGWALDKDILIPGNKVYGPDTCCFVPKDLNSLFTHKRSTQGLYPTGVNYHKHTNRFVAQISIGGKKRHLGLFETPEGAEAAYKIAKTDDVHRQAEIWKPQIDPRVYEAMLKYKITENILNVTV